MSDENKKEPVITTVTVTPKRRRDDKHATYLLNTVDGVVHSNLKTCEPVTVRVNEQQLLDLRHDPFVILSEPTAAPQGFEFAPEQPQTVIPESERPTDGSREPEDRSYTKGKARR